MGTLQCLISSFIPTISALDINTNDLFFNVSSLDFGNPDPTLTPFNRIYAPEMYEEHVKVNDGNSGWINDLLSQGGPDLAKHGELPNVEGTTYNYGYFRNKIPDVVINEGGFLRVNDQGPTAYLDEEESNQEIFKAYTKGCDGGDITVNNEGHFIIGKTFGNPTRKGFMHFTDGNKLTLNNGSEASVEKNSRLIFEEGSSAVIKNGGLLVARFGAKIYVESGATLRVRSGGKLRIMHWSDLIVEDGGRLIIEGGAIIQLWDNNGSDGNANIQIKGELRVNGEFEFSGSGYFTFHDSHELTFGPNAEGLILDGVAKGTRFIRLQDTELNIGDHKLELSNGKVEYLGSSKLVIETEGRAVLNQIELRAIDDGIGSATGLLSSGANLVDINNCDFYDLGYGIYSGGFENPGGVHKLFNSSLTNCTLGVWISSFNQFNFFNNVFEASEMGNNAIWAHDVDNVYSWGDVINGYDNSFNSGSSWGAIILTDVNNFHMESGRITNNDVGIVTPVDFKSNLFLSHGTIVKHNEIGIWTVKGGIGEDGENYGLVHATCSRFINNSEVAIRGVDVLLEIDAITNCIGCNPGEKRANGFVGERLFEICYVDHNISEVSARGNYWGENQEAPFPSQHTIQNQSFECNFWGPTNIELDASQAVFYEPTGYCVGGEGPGTEPLGLNMNGEDNLDVWSSKTIAEDRSSDLESSSYVAGFELYPNPASESVTIEIAEGKQTIRFLNALGQLQYETIGEGKILVDVRTWPRGMYLVESRNEKTSLIQSAKVILQ